MMAKKKPRLTLLPAPEPGPIGTLPREADGPHGATYRVTNAPSIEIEYDDGRVVPLANFAAEVVARITLDDGEQQDQRIRLRVLAPDQTVHELDVSPKEFASLAWVDRVPGCLLWPPPRKAWVRTAITLTSRPKTISVRRHLGWHRVGANWIWLHAGGALGAGAKDLEVEVEPELSSLTLPAPPPRDDLASLARSTLRLLGVAPRKLTVPLLGSALAPALVQATHGIMLVGKTGSGKSQLAALAQGLYGERISRGSDLKVAWSSSGHALEMLAHQAKDHPLVIDDFVVGTASGDEEVFDRISRGQGNRAGRTRMRGPAYHPRGLVISTAETLPSVHSAVARTLVLRHQEIDWNRLTQLQEAADAGVHASTMSGFLSWVAERKEKVERWVATRARPTTADFDVPGVHRRTPPALATVEAALAVFVKFCVEVGAVASPEATQLLSGFHDALRECLLEQLDVQLASDPARLLLHRVGRALDDGSGHLVSADGPGDGPGGRLGWIRDHVAYLDPDPCLELARKRGHSGPLREMGVEQVGKALDAADLIQVDRRGKSKRFKKRVVVAGKRVAGWAVRPAELSSGVTRPGEAPRHGVGVELDWAENWFTD